MESPATAPATGPAAGSAPPAEAAQASAPQRADNVDAAPAAGKVEPAGPTFGDVIVARPTFMRLGAEPTSPTLALKLLYFNRLANTVAIETDKFRDQTSAGVGGTKNAGKIIFPSAEAQERFTELVLTYLRTPVQIKKEMLIDFGELAAGNLRLSAAELEQIGLAMTPFAL